MDSDNFEIISLYIISACEQSVQILQNVLHLCILIDYEYVTSTSKAVMDYFNNSTLKNSKKLFLTNAKNRCNVKRLLHYSLPDHLCCFMHSTTTLAQLSFIIKMMDTFKFWDI